MPDYLLDETDKLADANKQVVKSKPTKIKLPKAGPGGKSLAAAIEFDDATKKTGKIFRLNKEGVLDEPPIQIGNLVLNEEGKQKYVPIKF